MMLPSALPATHALKPVRKRPYGVTKTTSSASVNLCPARQILDHFQAINICRHYGHTNCMLLNLVAPMEMVLNNGVHPVMGDKIGTDTGEVGTSFPSYFRIFTP